MNLLVLDEANDPAAVNRMLTWIYGSNYNDRPGIQAWNKPATDSQRSAGLGAPGQTFALALTGRSDTPHPLAQTLIDIDVYCIAEKYDLPGLQKMAIDKCMAQSWSEWTLEELTILVKKIYSSVPMSCKALRRKLIYDCADQAPGFFVKEDGTCAIGDAGNFASDLSQELQIRECDRKITELHHQLAMSKQRERLLQMRLNDVAVERDDELRLLSRAAQSSFRNENCKKCGSHFGAYLEALFPRRKLHLFLVCRACNTSH